MYCITMKRFWKIILGVLEEKIVIPLMMCVCVMFILITTESQSIELYISRRISSCHLLSVMMFYIKRVASLARATRMRTLCVRTRAFGFRVY